MYRHIQDIIKLNMGVIEVHTQAEECVKAPSCSQRQGTMQAVIELIHEFILVSGGESTLSAMQCNRRFHFDAKAHRVFL